MQLCRPGWICTDYSLWKRYHYTRMDGALSRAVGNFVAVCIMHNAIAFFSLKAENTLPGRQRVHEEFMIPVAG